MMIYLAIFVPLVLLAFGEACSERFRRRDSVAVSVVFMVIFWALSWLRWERGTDWASYMDFFTTNATDYGMATHSGYEWGFATLNYLVRLATGNYTVMLFVLSSILYVVAGTAIIKASRRPVFSVLVLFCLNLGFIFLTRQQIAVAFALLAVMCIVRGRRWGFFLSVAAGALFHYSILVFLPAWWIYRLKMDTLRFAVVMICGVILSLAISRLTVSALSGLPGFVGGKLAGYLESGAADFEGFGQGMARVLAGGLVNRGGVLLLAMLVVGRRRTEDSYAGGVINLYAFGLILFVMMAPITVALTRLASYYDVMAVFLIPSMLDHLKLERNRSAVALAVTVWLAWRLFAGAFNGPYGDLFVPYNTIFTKERQMIIY
jgi:hypothetical protein